MTVSFICNTDYIFRLNNIIYFILRPFLDYFIYLLPQINIIHIVERALSRIISDALLSGV